MPRIDNEVTSSYGEFIDGRLSYHRPYNTRYTINLTYSKKDQKKIDEFRQIEDKWILSTNREKNNNFKKVSKDKLDFLLGITFLFQVIILLAFISQLLNLTSNINISTFLGGSSIVIAAVYFASYFFIKRAADKDFMKTWIKRNPQPKKPQDYPKKPTIRERVYETRTYDDDLYDRHQDKKKAYRTEVMCPTCNSLIQFNKELKIPFQGKCNNCKYEFTFIYQKRTERYKTTDYGPRGGVKEKSHYIYYEGIKPTKPRPSSKGNLQFNTKRIPISQDVKDRVWNRDDGKCVQCGSNEDLEFDHIIPFSKGGANTYRNIQLLCEHCNRSKSAKLG